MEYKTLIQFFLFSPLDLQFKIATSRLKPSPSNFTSIYKLFNSDAIWNKNLLDQTEQNIKSCVSEKNSK